MTNNAAAPTAEEVVAKLKDDGDFDTLRLGIIRKVKENEELRNSIINEVKQSAILNLDGSEDMKPRQLSDGIYQEVGSKIMGQISDEIWKVIRSDDSKTKIRETVESVYDRLINPKCENDDHSSHKQQAVGGNNVHASPTNSNWKNETDSSPHKQQALGGNNVSASPPPAPTSEINTSDFVEAPPGFAPSDQQTSNNSREENKEMLLDRRPSSSSMEVNHHLPEVHQPSYDELPPGFAPHHGVDEQSGGGSDEDPDVPPGFG